MGHVYAEVMLSWAGERKLRMMVDTGSTFTVIPPELAQELGVPKPPRKTKVRLANGQQVEVEMSTLLVRIGDREAGSTVVILSGAEPLLGVETLEALGLKVNPSTGRLEPTRSWTVRV